MIPRQQSRETREQALVRNHEALTRVCANSLTPLASRSRQETAPASSSSPLSQRQEPIRDKRAIRRGGESCSTCEIHSKATGEYSQCDGDSTIISCGLRSRYQKDAFPQSGAGEGSNTHSLAVVTSTSRIPESALSVNPLSHSATASDPPIDEEWVSYARGAHAMNEVLREQGRVEEMQAKAFKSFLGPERYAVEKERYMSGKCAGDEGFQG